MTTKAVLGEGLAGVAGLVGGVLGFLAFRWVVGQGFYALALPGAGVGIGCALAARRDSWVRGVVCGVAGLFAGLVSEWQVFPFVADPGLAYFLGHLPTLKPITLIMILAGGLLGWWIGKGKVLA